MHEKQSVAAYYAVVATAVNLGGLNWSLMFWSVLVPCDQTHL